MTELRCPDCRRPFATEYDWHTFHEGDGEHLCWQSDDRITAGLGCGESPSDLGFCTWTMSPDGVWETSCGCSFVTFEGTPSENKMRFCAYCGGRLKEELGDAG